MKKRTASSQHVGDYEACIPDIKSFLAEHPTALQFYESLTPGYQKDWARYVFSTKREETQNARKEEMIEILLAGY